MLAGDAALCSTRFQIWIFEDFIRTLGAVEIADEYLLT